MKKTVINATWGGADIEGTVKMPLDEMLDKYAKEKIDKSVIKPLLTYADDGDELVSKVVPLIKDEIKILDEIISNSRKGLAAGAGMRNLTDRPGYERLFTKNNQKLFKKLFNEAKEEGKGNTRHTSRLYHNKILAKLRKSRLKAIIFLSNKNFIYSEKAHEYSVASPLVNLAIHGASRRIKQRDLNKKGHLSDSLTSREDALINIKRNEIILTAAIEAAESLKKSHNKSLRPLAKYDKTKDDAILSPPVKEKISLRDANKYFKAGNFAHPLLDARKILSDDHKNEQAKKVLGKAVKMKSDIIKDAKEQEKETKDILKKSIKYAQLIKDSKEIGRVEKDYGKALKMLRRAVKLIPDEIEARWGLATALHHTGELDESIKVYDKLIEDFPNDSGLKFEKGQVLLQNNLIQDGLKLIGEVMQESDEHDNFLARLGEIYYTGGQYKEADIAFKTYLKKYPHDYKAWKSKGDCLSKLNDPSAAQKAYQKAIKISPEYKEAEKALQSLCL